MKQLVPDKTVRVFPVQGKFDPEGTKLIPHTVSPDGNEFYVYVSIALFERHDLHSLVRKRLAQTHCSNVFGDGVLLDDLLESPAQNDADTLEMLRHMATERATPPLHLACSLLCQCYGVGVVVYEEENDDNDAIRSPSRVWKPVIADNDPATKYIHFLVTGKRLGLRLFKQNLQKSMEIYPFLSVGSLFLLHIFQFLIRTGSLLEMLLYPAAVSRFSVPVRVIESLPPGKKKKMHTGDTITRHGVYKLEAYHVATKTHIFIAHFVAPATKLRPAAQHIHYMRIDARSNKSEMRFTVEGCKEAKHPVYVYASYMQQGVRVAVLINHWKPDYCSPQIYLHETDDALIVVPCHDVNRANQLVSTEYGCQIHEKRKG